MAQLRKYQFDGIITTPTNTYNVTLDKFVQCERKADAITRFNRKLGQISIPGIVKFGEGSFAITLEVTEGTSTVNQLIADLQSLDESDNRTFDFDIIMQHTIKGVEQASYVLHHQNCSFLGSKLDEIGSKDTDDMLQITISFIPQSISKLSGAQM